MKINWSYIKAFALFAVVIFLYSFSVKRNTRRNLEKVSVEFTNGENLYITDAAVNKLLIVNKSTTKSVAKDSLDLNMLEKRLDDNPMIAKADVFLTVNGELGAIITQRQPIARVLSEKSFYIDSDGKAMPLSPNHSARVPLVIGVTKEQVEEVFPLLREIEQDTFLKENVVSVERDEKRKYILGLRNLDFKVTFGKIEHVNRKIENFKAFYKKMRKDKKFDAYQAVNLEFTNQVVGIKK